MLWKIGFYRSGDPQFFRLKLTLRPLQIPIPHLGFARTADVLRISNKGWNCQIPVERVRNPLDYVTPLQSPNANTLSNRLQSETVHLLVRASDDCLPQIIFRGTENGCQSKLPRFQNPTNPLPLENLYLIFTLPLHIP